MVGIIYRLSRGWQTWATFREGSSNWQSNKRCSIGEPSIVIYRLPKPLAFPNGITKQINRASAQTIDSREMRWQRADDDNRKPIWKEPEMVEKMRGKLFRIMTFHCYHLSLSQCGSFSARSREEAKKSSSLHEAGASSCYRHWAEKCHIINSLRSLYFPLALADIDDEIFIINVIGCCLSLFSSLPVELTGFSLVRVTD